MKRYTLYIGTQFDFKGEAIKDAAQREKTILAAIAGRHGGFSVQHVTGGYIMQNSGQLVTETSLQVTIFSDSLPAILESARQAREVFNQESVLLEDFQGNGQFVGEAA